MAYGIGFTTLTSVQVEFQNSISIKVHACLTITGEGWAEWAEWAQWAEAVFALTVLCMHAENGALDGSHFLIFLSHSEFA